MINYKFGTLSLSIALCSSLLSCNNDLEPVLTDLTSSYVDEIEVKIAKREATKATGDEEIINPTPDFDIDKLIPYQLKFDENSVIQVSQQIPTRFPFLDNEYIYDFSYKKGATGSWDDEVSYNFEPSIQGTMLEWKNIQETGQNGNGYSLYSLYFPIENKIRQKLGANNVVNYSVLQDQSTLENLIKSDILGAYHHTPKIFSRIKFKLYHLMTYVRIRLYVPVFDLDKNTGFRDDALQYATINNVTPDFAIEWGNIPLSDDEGPFVSPLAGEGSIKMYQHPLEPDRTIYQIPYKKYLPQNYFDQGIDTDYDRVRIYDFSVIIPKQKGTMDIDGKEHGFTETDFLNFYLRSNSGATTRYYFNQSYIGSISQDSDTKNDFQDAGTLNMNQGYFQYLELYVPRVGNQIIYLGANVIPWEQVGSEMLLKPKEDK